MSKWEGKWLGGRYYLNRHGDKVFVIEHRVHPHRYVVKLSNVHDEKMAGAEYTRFLLDPVAYTRPPVSPPSPPDAVLITTERIKRYIESIRKTVIDHQKARRSYLVDWSAKGLDLRTLGRKAFRVALASFGGGYDGRTEALNAFARFLVKEEELENWRTQENQLPSDPKAARAERVAYSLDELRSVHDQLLDQAMKDVLVVRVATGLHHTEIQQLEGCKVYSGPLPEKGAGIRKLGGAHEIQGVLQVIQKSRHRHRVSVTGATLRAALRLRERVPKRVAVWKKLEAIGVVPSNLRITFDTLASEIGVEVSYKGAGVPRPLVAQVMGHRAGSTMGPDRYEKVQVPRMIRLPLEDWNLG